MNKYLGIPHNYSSINCLTLVLKVYKDILGIDVELPCYPQSRKWINVYDPAFIDSWAQKYSTKVSLTQLKKYDLIVFNYAKYIDHFSLYLENYKMLHVRENSMSKIESMTSEDIQNIYACYRLNELV